MIELAVEPEPARSKLIETGVATPPLPAFRHVPSTVPVPAARGMAPSASMPPAALLGDRPAPLAGQMWLVVGAMLLCAVMVVPGAAAVLAFFGISGFIVGGLSLAIDLTWQYQVFIFAVLGVALVVLWILFDPTQRRNDNPDPTVNDRGPGALVGRVFELEKPIEGGNGMLTFGGTSWRIAGRDCAAGKRVRVLRAEGTLLIVDPVEC